MKPKQLPSGAWRCRVYLGKNADGKAVYESITRIDYYDCLEEAAKIAKHHHETERDSSMLTLGEAIDKYIAMKDGVLSPSTIRNYDSTRRNHLQPLMTTPLRLITANVAQQAFNHEAKQYAPKTVLNVYRVFTAVMNQFTDREIKISLPVTEDRDVNTLTEEQIRTLILALQGDKSEVPILIALFLGLRRSEIMALEHSDYDPETQILVISKAMVPNKEGEFVIKKTKTKKSRRKLAVPSYLAAKLSGCIERGEPFYNVAPGRPYKKLQQICTEYGLPKMSMHDLRHQNASIMLSLGIPDKYAMERGGWSSNHTMKSIYQHTMSEERLQTDAKMNDYFDSLAP